MSDRHVMRRPLAWQSTLAEMKRHGTRVARSCTNARCGCWLPLGVEALIATHGADFMLWDRRDPCHACGRPAHYMASPAPATPFRPLSSGPEAEMARKAWLRSFGFTRRDRLRIQRLAEQVTEHSAPAALCDLDVPYRVGACLPGHESRFTGGVLGFWAGRTLLWWPMNERERGVWAKRPPGPRAL